MATERKGFGQGASPRKGTIGQRQLLLVLKNLVDQASAKGAGLARDQARRSLRETMREQDWNTAYILMNLSVKRCRALASMGYPVPRKFMFTDEKDIERINAWHEGRR